MSLLHRKLSPGGSAIAASALWRSRTLGPGSNALHTLIEGLERLVGPARVSFHASGREALRVLFADLAQTSGRSEVLIPAYTCFSIPAAAVAAGCRVRLVDVTLCGQIDPQSLERTPLDNVAALVVGNLVGVAEPIARLRDIASGAGVCVIDDAAQTLGAQTADGLAGARGDIGMLSFGRGKPLCALGGGALVFGERSVGFAAPPDLEPPTLNTPTLKPWTAAARAFAYDLARQPSLFGLLSAIPQLGIGQTHFEPRFARGAIDGASLCLAAAQVGDVAQANERRSKTAHSLAAGITAQTSFVPLLAPDGERGVYPRIGLVAPNRTARDRALGELAALGATAFYPTALGEVAALRPHLVGESDCVGAREFCDRLLTLPTHTGLDDSRIERAVTVLRTLAQSSA